ncbi:MAG: PD-(D/E)XK nuclease family protein [Chloroflexi bacterium]|nr:PD-(D/E)XK nuclease family protein [Chloroflexota bacterium]
MRQFIDWAERQAEEGTRVVETVVPEPDDDAVRIMTIHAAKGLEFPIVLLAGLNVERGSGQKPDSVLWDSEGRMEATVGRHFQTPGYEERSQREEQMEQFEKVRLLYVGATRARDHLIVSLHHKASSSGPKSLAAQLYLVCRDNDELWHDIKPVALPHEEPAPAGFDDSPEKFKRWSEDRERRIEDLRRVPMRSATEIVKEFAGVSGDPNVQKDPPVEEVPPWRRGRAGTTIGRAVHAVLQSIDLESRTDLESAARAQADAEGIAGRWQEITRMVEAVLESPSIREAVAEGRYWRELFVSAPIGEAGVEGFIDLLYETDKGLVVVDYKTDRAPSEEDLEAALTRYTPQGAAYALAIEEALGRRVERCVFVFAEPGRAREKEVSDLRTAIEQVRERISTGPRPYAQQGAEQSQLSFPGLSDE